MIRGYFSKYKYRKRRTKTLNMSMYMYKKEHKDEFDEERWNEICDGKPVTETGKILGTCYESILKWEVKQKPKRMRGVKR